MRIRNLRKRNHMILHSSECDGKAASGSRLREGLGGSQRLRHGTSYILRHSGAQLTTCHTSPAVNFVVRCDSATEEVVARGNRCPGAVNLYRLEFSRGGLMVTDSPPATHGYTVAKLAKHVVTPAIKFTFGRNPTHMMLVYRQGDEVKATRDWRRSLLDHGSRVVAQDAVATRAPAIRIFIVRYATCISAVADLNKIPVVTINFGRLGFGVVSV